MNLQALINNACTLITHKHFHKLTSEALNVNFKKNVLATVQITQTAITSFRQNKFGRIITITTAFLLNNPPVGLSSYVAEKAYLASLSKSWANENKNFNITANCIAPSMMLTNFTSVMDERVIEKAVQAHPFQSLLTIEETAGAVEQMLLASRHVNGATWILNGGMDVI
jgi:3-oxoacyl-[acyl-carrier protein] reductase